MSKIRPFRAVRPTRDKAHLVASRPFYAYKKNVLKAKLETNPYTFMHIINPEFDKKHKSEANSVERFKAVKEKYEQFVEKKHLFQEKSEMIYVYRQTKENYHFSGIIAAASVDDYLNGIIKKHEQTLTSRVEVFSSYLGIVEFNAEPVLLSYPKDNKISDFYAKKMNERPEYEFCTADGVIHEMWLVHDKKEVAFLIKAFENIPSLYIADGHHRCSSSAHHAEKLRANGKSNTETDSLLAYIIDDEQLKIWEFNRLVKNLGKYQPATLLEKLSEKFTLKELKKPEKPQKKYDFVMYLDKKWHLLSLKDSFKDFKTVQSSIDAQVLTDYILDPILNISDLKTDDRIGFLSGEEGILGLKKWIDKGDFQLGFILYPVSFDEIKKISDIGATMPPKSTWIEPKMRSGLTILKV